MRRGLVHGNLEHSCGHDGVGHRKTMWTRSGLLCSVFEHSFGGIWGHRTMSLMRRLSSSFGRGIGGGHRRTMLRRSCSSHSDSDGGVVKERHFACGDDRVENRMMMWMRSESEIEWAQSSAHNRTLEGHNLYRLRLRMDTL